MKKEVKWAILVIIIEEVTLISLMVALFLGLNALGGGIALPAITFLTNNFFLDIIFIMILLPFYVIVVAGISNLILPLFIKIIKKRHRKGQSLVKIKVEGSDSIKSNFFKSLFPALMAVSIAMVVAPFRNYLNFLFTPTILNPMIPSFLFIMIFSFMLVPFTSLIFALLWSLNASGVFIIRKSASGKLDENFYVQNTGNFFLTYLKGFTGIGTVFSYTVLFIDLFINYMVFGTIQEMIVTIIATLLAGSIPIILALTITPGAIFNDNWIRKEHSALEKVLQDIPDGTDTISGFIEKTK